jgi:hypothetical protein
MNAPLTHYIVIRRDLTFGEYSAQLAHAGEAYTLLSGGGARFALNETVAVVKGARNEKRLLKLEQAIRAAGFPHVAIREELGEKGGRLAGQLTCISLMPCDRELVEPIVREFHTIEALDAPTVLPG